MERSIKEQVAQDFWQDTFCYFSLAHPLRAPRVTLRHIRFANWVTCALNCVHNIRLDSVELHAIFYPIL